MVRVIFFDMGGTLDGDGHWLDRFISLYASCGLDLPRETIRRGFDAAERRAAADADIVTADMAALVRRHLEWQFAFHGLDDARAYEQMVDWFLAPLRRAARENVALLSELRARGFTLGVISNACGNARTLCDDLGYSPYLSTIVDSRIVGVAKPDARIYQLALDRLDVEASNAMMVGDSYERDVVPAHGLGMRTAWLKRDAANVRLKPDATYVPDATCAPDAAYDAASAAGVADLRISSLGELAFHLARAERASA